MPKVRLITRSYDGERQAGFSLVEVLLAAALFGFLSTALVGALIYGRAPTSSSGDRARATYLAEEGIDATRNIADAAYANLTAGNHGLAQSGGQWVFSGTSDLDPTRLYTRVINVSSGGTNRQTVTSTVTWAQPGGGSGSVVLTAQITNWAATLKSWATTTATTNFGVSGSANAAIKTATQGNYAYSIEDITGVTNMVVTNLTNNTNVASIILPGGGKPQNIAVSGNYAYVVDTTDSQEFLVVDISNPSSPVYKTSLDLTGVGNGQGIYIYGNYAYVVRASDVTAGANEFNVIDITNPLAPVFKGGVDDNITMNEVYVNGNYAFVATSTTTGELMVFDISNPAAPVLVTGGTYNAPTSSAALAIAGNGNVIYLGTGTAFDIVTVGNLPGTPTFTLTGTFTANSTINDLDYDITNGYAFLGTASTTTGVQVVNIATPSAPTLTKAYTTANAVRGLSYDTSLDEIVVAVNSTTLQLGVATRN